MRNHEQNQIQLLRGPVRRYFTKLGRGYGQQFTGLWHFVEWAEQNGMEKEWDLKSHQKKAS